ncbi:MAG: DUF6288 domain-containing protein [Planctomycetota bacterium]
MINRRRFAAYVLFPVLLCFAVTPAVAQRRGPEIPDFTRGDAIPDGYNHDWNLGPTGARGWIYSNRMETTEARQILITEVESGSPADSRLEPGDVILGVSGRDFSYDPRTELGKAITAAEAGTGLLDLMVWRPQGDSGNTGDVTLELAVKGSYSETAPFDCEKSRVIFEQGCEVLAMQMTQDPRRGNRIARAYNVLALLASGQEEYLPLIREQVSDFARFTDPRGRMLHSWYYGPANLVVAEYTLATGDTSFMDDLERITMEIVRGQSDVGSWGHRFKRPDGRLNGYGMMNAPGLPMILSLVLARKAGINNPELDEAIERSTGLIRFYVGKGSVPYGDHAPWIETHDDNGKNGVAAVIFNLLGDHEAASYFSRMSVASHGNDRELGHTGNYFNLLWAMPGVAISGPNATGAWLEEYGWYFDLARRWDGAYRHQGPPERGNDSYNEWNSTGAFLLAYAQPLKQLYITGKQDDVVSPVSHELAESLVNDGRDYSHRTKHEAYDVRTDEQLLQGLSSWSPVVRERSAIALSHREADYESTLIEMLRSESLNSRVGACQALQKYGVLAEGAVPALAETLDAEDLWLRIKAAEALAAMGDAARPTIPKLLAMLASSDPENDPRNMQQRFLCFALFNRGEGLLSRGLNGVDRDALYAAVRAGLGNEDGRARGSLASVYQRLSYEEIEPLLPAIYHAVVEPAPSGEMFADGIRLAGLDILAEHRIEEGMQLCIDVIEFDRWGQNDRLPRCLRTLQKYGRSAMPVVDELEEILDDLWVKEDPKAKPEQIDLLEETIAAIKDAEDGPDLRSITDVE